MEFAFKEYLINMGCDFSITVIIDYFSFKNINFILLFDAIKETGLYFIQAFLLNE